MQLRSSLGTQIFILAHQLKITKCFADFQIPNQFSLTHQLRTHKCCFELEVVEDCQVLGEPLQFRNESRSKKGRGLTIGEYYSVVFHSPYDCTKVFFPCFYRKSHRVLFESHKVYCTVNISVKPTKKAFCNDQAL